MVCLHSELQMAMKRAFQLPHFHVMRCSALRDDYLHNKIYLPNSIIKLLLINLSDGSNTILSNIEQTRTSFFEH